MRTIRFAVWCALVLALPGIAGSEVPGKKKPDTLMQRKLQHAQKVLEGVAVNNFEKIATNAEELIDISRAAEFRVLKTPRYEVYSKEFQQTAETLVKNAKDKNLDAAALSYVELTLICVKCHKHVREVKMVRLDP